jgi:hypothetical protein
VLNQEHPDLSGFAALGQHDGPKATWISATRGLYAKTIAYLSEIPVSILSWTALLIENQQQMI